MNKLLVSDIIKLDSGIYHLEFLSKKIEIEIDGNVKIYLINPLVKEINIKINSGCKLDLYKFNNNSLNELIINIVEDNDTILNYNESIINNKSNSVTINNIIEGNNNKSNINIRNISNNDLSTIKINVLIKDNTIDNIALEDLKGINNGGFIHIEPNIICNTNEVVANHLTTIGSINEEYLNYLMGKGIKKDTAKEMILNSFIYSNMDEYIKKGGGEINE